MHEMIVFVFFFTFCLSFVLCHLSKKKPKSNVVLVSSTFSVRPGTQINANYTVDIAQDLVWGPNSQNRIGTGLVNNTSGTTTAALLSDDTFGERITLFDMKFAKNVRELSDMLLGGVRAATPSSARRPISFLTGAWPIKNLSGA